jgi:hypothetical protein
MEVFIIGIAGGVGGHVARQLFKSAHRVNGLARKSAKKEELSGNGITATMGDLVKMSFEDIAGAERDLRMPSAGSRRLAQQFSRWPSLGSLKSNWSKTPTGSASGRKKLRLMTAYRTNVRTTEAGSPEGSAHWPFHA